jgi:hypothetical protein
MEGHKWMKFYLEKKEVTISPTPIILAYFAEKRKGNRKEVTKFVLDVFKRLENTTISTNAVFRGDMTGMTDDITSETVDNII